MLLPAEDAQHFLRVYKAMLCQVVGRQLKATQEYLAARDSFYQEKWREGPPTEDEDLLQALGTASFGDFYIGRHLKRWTEMVGPRGLVYRVKGITSELSEFVPPWTSVRTAVMRFKNHWICDGIVGGYNIHYGPGIRKDILARIRKG